MFGRKKMYQVLRITTGNVEQHMTTEYALAVHTFQDMVNNAIIQGTPCDVVLQTTGSIVMSFHSAGVKK